METTTKTTVKKQSFFRKLIAQPEVGVLIPLILLCVITALGNSNFLTSANLTSILRLLISYAFCGMGVSFCILCGDTDISVGTQAGMCAMISATLMINFGWPIWAAILMAVLAAIICGIIKGILVAKLNMYAYIATIGMMFVCKGIKYLLTNGYPAFPYPEPINNFAKASPLGLSWPVLIVIACYVVLEIMLRRTPFGRKMYAVGDNREVARLAGINVFGVRTIAYIMCSVCAAMAGILNSFQIGLGDPVMGEGWEMYAIASAAVGGIAMKGGKGSLIGTAIGVLFISVLNNAMVMFQVNSNAQTALTGVLLIVAVLLDLFKSSRKVKA